VEDLFGVVLVWKEVDLDNVCILCIIVAVGM